MYDQLIAHIGADHPDTSGEQTTNDVQRHGPGHQSPEYLNNSYAFLKAFIVLVVAVLMWAWLYEEPSKALVLRQ